MYYIGSPARSSGFSNSSFQNTDKCTVIFKFINSRSHSEAYPYPLLWSFLHQRQSLVATSFILHTLLVGENVIPILLWVRMSHFCILFCVTISVGKWFVQQHRVHPLPRSIHTKDLWITFCNSCILKHFHDLCHIQVFLCHVACHPVLRFAKSIETTCWPIIQTSAEIFLYFVWTDQSVQRSDEISFRVRESKPGK